MFFLSIQNTYTHIELALFDSTQIIDQVTEDKIHASKMLIPLLDALLKKNNLTKNDLAFIATNQGPGPFTTLRVVISSVNGLAFATGIPLVGVNALHALLTENNANSCTFTVALLNAFNKDVYYAIQKNGSSEIDSAADNIITTLERIKSQLATNQTVYFVGNGATMHAELTQQIFGTQAVLADPMPQTCSVKTIGEMALEKWRVQQDLSNQLFPIYMKSMTLFNKQ